MNVSNGYNSRDIYSLAVNDQYMFAASYAGGVWKRPLSEIITVVDNSVQNKPERFSLGQNFPNPFNPSTTIKYSIPKNSLVRLKVYNILGEEVAILVNEEKPVGTYEVKFNATNLPSGVYFYRLQAGSFVETKKMIIIK